MNLSHMGPDGHYQLSPSQPESLLRPFIDLWRLLFVSLSRLTDDFFRPLLRLPMGYILLLPACHDAKTLEEPKTNALVDNGRAFFFFLFFFFLILIGSFGSIVPKPSSSQLWLRFSNLLLSIVPESLRMLFVATERGVKIVVTDTPNLHMQ